MDYKALAVCQKPNEKPFVVSIYTYFDKDVVISNLERFKRKYKDTEINVLSSWIEKTEIIDYKEPFYKRICENYWIHKYCFKILKIITQSFMLILEMKI
ncbi:MAG: hypothetical protein HFJ33_06750 [Clostridia bacterium]|nr:hypothetical protein [Clostridia bacterium]